MAEYNYKIDPESRDVRPFYTNSTFTPTGILEKTFLLNSTTPDIDVPVSNIGTIFLIMVIAPANGVTTLTISYNDGAAKTLPLEVKVSEPLIYHIGTTLSGYITTMTINNTYTGTELQEVDVRVYGA